MKNINYLNYFFVGVPAILFLIAHFDANVIAYAMLFSIITGFFQVVIGGCMLADEPRNNNLQL